MTNAQILRLLKLHKAVERSDQHTRRTYTRLLYYICSHYHTSSTAQILSYYDLLFYVNLIILIFDNFSKRNIKAP